MNEAELRFIAYLRAHGYEHQYEPDYKVALELSGPVSTCPDFLISRGGARAVAEVRQFETTHIRDRLERSGGYAALSSWEVYGPLRSALWEKAQQLRPLAGAGVPLIIVVANPLAADVALDAHHLLAALWGNPAFVVPIDSSTGGPAVGQDPHVQLEDYGVFASPVMVDAKVVGWENRHPHVTAVVVVHERLHSADWREEMLRSYRAADKTLEAATDAAFEAMKAIEAATARGEEPDGSYQWVTVYELNGCESIPLPAGWFGGSRDERYGSTRGGYGRLPPIQQDGF